MAKRKIEFFKPTIIKSHDAISMTPKHFYKQERDWTCSIACIRTILSGVDENVMSEDEFIEKYKFEKGPHFSKDIKAKGVLANYDAIYGCDLSTKDFDLITDLMHKGYYVMVENMYNYSHWLVLLGFYPIGDDKDIEKYKILCYDPYYDNVRLINLDEFINMWVDGYYEENNVEKDFIAVRL